jgi:hypothetical protein
MVSEPGWTHIIRQVPMWLVEVDLSDLGLDESAVNDLLARVKISLSKAGGGQLSLDTWRVDHDELADVPRSASTLGSPRTKPEVTWTGSRPKSP